MAKKIKPSDLEALFERAEEGGSGLDEATKQRLRAVNEAPQEKKPRGHGASLADRRRIDTEL